jgi:hypothetical protein
MVILAQGTPGRSPARSSQKTATVMLELSRTNWIEQYQLSDHKRKSWVSAWEKPADNLNAKGNNRAPLSASNLGTTLRSKKCDFQRGSGTRSMSRA